MEALAIFDRKGELVESNGRPSVFIFVDFECPACKHYHQTVVRTLLDTPSISVKFVHFPLTNPNAIPATIASNCAANQGRFSQFVDVAYAHQGDFGTISWSDLAAEAGVPDLTLFQSCTADPNERQAVISSRSVGDLIGVNGTPAIAIAGRLHPRPLSGDAIRNFLES
jgi:protein-disulfide isomerase